MKIIWTEITGVPSCLGHSVEFYFRHDNGKRDFVAFLGGYDWFHYSPETISIQIRKSTAFDDPAIVQTAKQDIEMALQENRLWQGEISERIFA